MLRVLHKYLRNDELLLLGICAVIYATATYFSHAWDVLLHEHDSIPNLYLARLITDSLTPGISQGGVWNPLIHFLLIPTTRIEFLYRTGLAASVTHFPLALFGILCFYRLCNILTENQRTLGFIGSIFLLISPYFLYYSTSPMSEASFLPLLLCATYFGVLHFETWRLKDLILCGIFVSLTYTARFEGLTLLPIIFAACLMKLLQERKKFLQIEAFFIILATTALLGIAWIVSYGWMFTGDPLSFITPSQRIPLSAIQRQSIGLTWIINCIRLFLSASYFTIGKYPVNYSLLLGPILLLWLGMHKKMSHLLGLFMLLSPSAIVLVAMIASRRRIDLSGSSVRYGLTWVGFVTIAPVLVASLVAKFKQLKPIQMYAIQALILIPFVVFTASYSWQIIAKKHWWKATINIKPSMIDKHYDYGKILMIKLENDDEMFATKVPFRNFILETNFVFFDQAAAEPWLFARFVFVPNASARSAKFQKDLYAASRKELFLRFYETIDKNFYRLKEGEFRKYAIEQGWNTDSIPSLNPSLEWWDPHTIKKAILDAS